MNKTRIEWTDYTWNPITGCTNGCHYCYARKIAERFRGTKAFPNGFEPTIYLGRFDQPLKLKKPSKIFVCSMGELFFDTDQLYDGEKIERSHIRQPILDVIRQCPQHTFQFLTKKPQNLAKWSPFPDNCWVGASVTNNRELDMACFGIRSVEAKIKFISFEPLLESMNEGYTPLRLRGALECIDANWVIIGAQTNPYRPPQVEWVEEIVNACDLAEIPVFLKDSLEKCLPPRAPFVTNPLGDNEWCLRQEFPGMKAYVPTVEVSKG